MLLTKEEAFGPALVDEHGNRTEVDGDTYALLRTTLRVIQGGKSSSDADKSLSTGQVAEMLGVSARTVARMLDAGAMPFTRNGTGHRRVMLSDVVAYKKCAGAERSRALDEMRGIASEAGLYDLDLDGYLDRLEG